MTVRLARLVLDGPTRPGHRRLGGAFCYSCGEQLAMRGATVQLLATLEPRPAREPRTGLPRFGPIRRQGHRDRRAATGAEVRTGRAPTGVTRDIGDPGAIYVNCPACDRGQVIRWQ